MFRSPFTVSDRKLPKLKTPSKKRRGTNTWIKPAVRGSLGWTAIADRLGAPVHCAVEHQIRIGDKSIKIVGALVGFCLDIEMGGPGLTSHNMANVPVMNN